jgi:hypothetical protein
MADLNPAKPGSPSGEIAHKLEGKFGGKASSWLAKGQRLWLSATGFLESLGTHRWRDDKSVNFSLLERLDRLLTLGQPRRCLASKLPLELVHLSSRHR